MSILDLKRPNDLEKTLIELLPEHVARKVVAAEVYAQGDIIVLTNGKKIDLLPDDDLDDAFLARIENTVS